MDMRKLRKMVVTVKSNISILALFGIQKMGTQADQLYSVSFLFNLELNVKS